MNTPPPHPVAAWYGVRTKPKTEHQVADRLRRYRNIDIFCPRIRYRKPTRRGPVWFLEALFPTYLFARFDPADLGTAIRSTVDVRGLISFGAVPAPIPDAVVERLRAEFGEKEEKVFDEPVRPGERACVVEGPLAGIEAVVTRVLPARQRVRILFLFLGRETEADVPLNTLTRTEKPRVLAR